MILYVRNNLIVMEYLECAYLQSVFHIMSLLGIFKSTNNMSHLSNVRIQYKNVQQQNVSNITLFPFQNTTILEPMSHSLSKREQYTLLRGSKAGCKSALMACRIRELRFILSLPFFSSPHFMFPTLRKRYAALR